MTTFYYHVVFWTGPAGDRRGPFRAEVELDTELNHGDYITELETGISNKIPSAPASWLLQTGGQNQTVVVVDWKLLDKAEGEIESPRITVIDR